MDVRGFSDFLKSELKINIDVYTQNIGDVAYDKIENMHRAAGALGVLRQLYDGLDNLVKVFYDKQNSVIIDNNDSSHS